MKAISVRFFATKPTTFRRYIGNSIEAWRLSKLVTELLSADQA